MLIEQGRLQGRSAHRQADAGLRWMYRQTAKSFLAAANFYELLADFGEPDSDVCLSLL